MNIRYILKQIWNSEELVSATLGACQGKIYKPDPMLSDRMLGKELKS